MKIEKTEKPEKTEKAEKAENAKKTDRKSGKGQKKKKKGRTAKTFPCPPSPVYSLSPSANRIGLRPVIKSKAKGPNPKDIVGAEKISISTLPGVAIIHGAHAMMDGARKYNRYNWRARKVTASIYVDAMMRHILSWFEGEELADDSHVHHMGHVIGCAAVLLDAQHTGNLIDDRPIVGNGKLASALLNKLRAAKNNRA